LIGVEDYENPPRCNCAKINSQDLVRCVPAVVRGRSIVMEVTNGMPIRKGLKKRISNVISVGLAA
jgi:hypothetical protein